MVNTKLFRLLETFSKKERNDFHDFLRSPFHNRDEELLALYEVLMPALDAKDALLTEKEVFARAFPGHPYHFPHMRNLKHALLKQSRAFLAHRRLQQDTLQQDLYLVIDARERMEGDGFQKEWNRMEKSLEQTELSRQIPDQLLLRYRMGIEQAISRARNGARSADSFLMETIQRLDDFYLLQKLRLACAWLNQLDIVATDAALSGPKLDAFWEVKEPLRPTMRDLYWCVYQMLLHPGQDQHWFTLVHLLFQENAGLPGSIFQELFTYATNRCIQRIKAGDLQAKGHYLDLLKKVMTHPDAVKPWVQSRWHRKNMVQFAAKEGDFGFAAQIAHDEVHLLPEIDHTYNQAVIYFFQGLLGEAMRLFQKVVDEPKDSFYELDAKVFLLLIYYVLADSRMESLNDSFRMSIRRNGDVSEGHKQRFASFQRFFARLIKHPFSDGKKVESFKAKVANKEARHKHDWVFHWFDTLRKQKK